MSLTSPDPPCIHQAHLASHTCSARFCSIGHDTHSWLPVFALFTRDAQDWRHRFIPAVAGSEGEVRRDTSLCFGRQNVNRAPPDVRQRAGASGAQGNMHMRSNKGKPENLRTIVASKRKRRSAGTSSCQSPLAMLLSALINCSSTLRRGLATRGGQGGEKGVGLFHYYSHRLPHHAAPIFRHPLSPLSLSCSAQARRTHSLLPSASLLLCLCLRIAAALWSAKGVLFAPL
ncbi:hypothetical protein GQ54DRAFT_101971 [Martensiomyces pterosporus]|nr:hypothetical protein GQ54DRAFT_101971 [Martensiomyces pterosporus]